MSVLLLAEAKRYLRITISDPDQDAELQATIDSAEITLADLLGPLAPTEVVERVDGGTDTLILSHLPVVSLTTVHGINPGATIDPGDLTPNKDTGVVKYADGIGVFVSNEYTVTYQAGWADLPADLLGGLKKLVRKRWSADQRGPARRGDDASDDASAKDEEELPKSVRDLVVKYRRDETGFA